MPIQFVGKTMPGLVTDFHIPGREPKFKRTNYFGLRGESEIFGGIGGRSIPLRILTHGFFQSWVKLHQDIHENLDKMIGQHGTLIVSHNYQTFLGNKNSTAVKNLLKWSPKLDDVTLEHWEPIALPGRDDADAFLDVAGMIDGGWIQYIELRFRQLK